MTDHEPGSSPARSAADRRPRAGSALRWQALPLAIIAAMGAIVLASIFLEDSAPEGVWRQIAGAVRAHGTIVMVAIALPIGRSTVLRRARSDAAFAARLRELRARDKSRRPFLIVLVVLPLAALAALVIRSFMQHPEDAEELMWRHGTHGLILAASLALVFAIDRRIGKLLAATAPEHMEPEDVDEVGVEPDEEPR